MKWSEEKVKRLHDLAFAGKSNAEIAKALGVGINEVYAKRSQLSITIPKVKATRAENPDLTPEVEFHTVASFENLPTVKAEVIKRLAVLLMIADKSIKGICLVDEGRQVCISYKNKACEFANIECDSPLAIIVDITRRCMYGGGSK